MKPQYDSILCMINSLDAAHRTQVVFKNPTLHIYIRPYKYNEYHHTFPCFFLDVIIFSFVETSHVLSSHQEYNLFLSKCDEVESVFMRLIDNLLHR